MSHVFSASATSRRTWSRRVLPLVVALTALGLGWAIDAQDTPQNFPFQGTYWSSDKYGSCVESDGTAYSTPEAGDNKCDSANKGSCMTHYDGDNADLTVGQCLFCGPDSGDWSGPEDLPHDNSKHVSAAKIISMKAYGSCTATGAASGQKCVKCPLFFCAKVRMYDGTCAEKCDAATSEVYAFATSGACDPSATP